MAKPGRNDPCPCASGEKYKRCCLSAEQQAQSAQSAQTAAATKRPPAPTFDVGDELDRLSNRAAALIHAGRLDEAEKAISELKEEYPELIDWLDRTAMLHEKRGDLKLAAEFHRRCLEMMAQVPEDYDEEGRNWRREKIRRLETEVSADHGPAST